MIPDPTQTATVNFNTSKQLCEVLTASLINREALEIRAHATQVTEGRAAGQKRKMNREERELEGLMLTTYRNGKRKGECS